MNKIRKVRAKRDFAYVREVSFYLKSTNTILLAQALQVPTRKIV